MYRSFLLSPSPARQVGGINNGPEKEGGNPRLFLLRLSRGLMNLFSRPPPW